MPEQLPLIRDLRMAQGETKTLLEVGFATFVFTGARMDVKHDSSPATSAIATFTSGEGGAFTIADRDDAGSLITLTVDNTQSVIFDPGTYVYDIFLTTADGEPERWYKGTFTIDEAVTRNVS